MDSLEEKLTTEIGLLDKAGLWKYLEQSRAMKKQAELIESLCKERCKTLMGDGEYLALDGDAGVYVAYSPRYEVAFMDAERVVQDQDLLNQITKIDLTKAKSILPELVWLELNTKRQLIGEPTKKLMIGKIKNL